MAGALSYIVVAAPSPPGSSSTNYFFVSSFVFSHAVKKGTTRKTHAAVHGLLVKWSNCSKNGTFRESCVLNMVLKVD